MYYEHLYYRFRYSDIYTSNRSMNLCKGRWQYLDWERLGDRLYCATWDTTFVTWELKVRFLANKNGLILPIILLLTVPRRFFCCSSFVFVRLWFHMWRLCCPYLFLISPSRGVSRGRCFVISSFPGYVQLYF